MRKFIPHNHYQTVYLYFSVFQLVITNCFSISSIFVCFINKRIEKKTTLNFCKLISIQGEPSLRRSAHPEDRRSRDNATDYRARSPPFTGRNYSPRFGAPPPPPYRDSRYPASRPYPLETAYERRGPLAGRGRDG